MQIDPCPKSSEWATVMSGNFKNPSDKYSALPEEIRALRRGIVLLLDKVNVDITVAVANNEPFRCMQVRGFMLSLALHVKENFQFLDNAIYDNSTSIKDLKSGYVWSDYNHFRRLNPVEIGSMMANARIDKVAARRCIDSISQIVGFLLVEEIARYKQLLSQHSKQKGDSAHKNSYSQALFREVEIIEGVREVYASALGLLEDFVASA